MADRRRSGICGIVGSPARRPGGAALLRWALAAGVLPGASPAAGQLPAASAAVPATGYAYSARSRGAVAVGANPAGLGMPDNPAWSMVVPSLGLRAGLDPVTLGDLARFEGETVPQAVKLDWQERVATAGREDGSVRAELTGLALSRGRWGVQVTGLAAARLSLAPDATELLLFGNAGRTGEPRELDLRGSRMDGFAVTTVGFSTGLPVSRGPRGAFAVGVTVTVSLGHALLLGRDAGSLTRNDPLEVAIDLPVVHPDFDRSGFSSGWGVGVDVGGAWQRGPWSAGVVVDNLVQTFDWNPADLVFRPGQALFDAEDVESDFDKRPLEEAPLDLRTEVEALTFRPRVSLGAAYRPGRRWVLSGEIQRRLGRKGLEVAPRSRVSGGAEYTAGFLTLRAGLGHATDGWLAASGLGVELGPVRIDGAGVAHRGDEGDAVSWALSLSVTPR